MLRTPPPQLHLPRGSVLVEDPDEEIFLLYTRKLQVSAPPVREQASGNDAADEVKTDGLGFASEAGEVVPVTLTVTDPRVDIKNASEAIKGGRKPGSRRKTTTAASALAEEVTVSVELHQSLDALRHRKGDTGSVLWRLSLHLAKYLLRSHHFPDPEHPPLFTELAQSTVLELGSGTGFLGIALRDIILSPSPANKSRSTGTAPSGRWLFSDQLANLPLVVRNLRANGVLEPPSSPPLNATALKSPRPKLRSLPSSEGSSSQRDGTRASTGRTGGLKPRERVEVLELDWLAEAAAWDREKTRPESIVRVDSGADSAETAAAGPLVILAIDCIYNPSLSAPLAKTILRQARVRDQGQSTVVVVASELRDEEPLEVFLRAWIDEARDGWTIARLGWEDEGERRAAGLLATSQYVVWVAWANGQP